MKKILLSLTAILMFGSAFKAQDSSDDKVRFGLRVTPQPMWFTSGDKNATPNGAKFGVGFGLNLEFRLSGVASFLTGIGADFEGGKYTFRNDAASNYRVMYLMNENSEFVDPNGNTDGINNKIYKSNTAFVVKERTVKTSYVSVPIILKLSTKEYSGLKYFGMFGGELNIRLKALATDIYFESGKFSSNNADTVYKFKSSPGIESQSDINITKDFSPIRLCFNAGLGAEYRIAGSTSAFVSINYSRSLLNQTKKESEFAFYKTEPSSGKSTFIQQNLKSSGIRINIGIMF